MYEYLRVVISSDNLIDQLNAYGKARWRVIAGVDNGYWKEPGGPWSYCITFERVKISDV